jgi:hypothetical protein
VKIPSTGSASASLCTSIWTLLEHAKKKKKKTVTRFTPKWTSVPSSLVRPIKQYRHRARTRLFRCSARPVSVRGAALRLRDHLLSIVRYQLQPSTECPSRYFTALSLFPINPFQVPAGAYFPSPSIISSRRPTAEAQQSTDRSLTS